MLRNITRYGLRGHLVVAVVLVAIGLLGGTPRDGATASNPPSVYWGFYSPDIPWDPTTLAAFDTAAQKKVSIVSFGQPWMKGGVLQSFDPTPFDLTRAHGRGGCIPSSCALTGR